jgi:hypothetical protein
MDDELGQGGVERMGRERQLLSGGLQDLDAGMALP